MKLLSGIKNSWNNWLRRLAEANKQQFGSETPDCCKINRPEARDVQHTHH